MLEAVYLICMSLDGFKEAEIDMRTVGDDPKRGQVSVVRNLETSWPEFMKWWPQTTE
jgi:hypothetical protein